MLCPYFHVSRECPLNGAIYTSDSSGMTPAAMWKTGKRDAHISDRGTT